MEYEIKKLSPFRLMSMYAYEALGPGHNMYAQIDLDITGIRKRLRLLRMEGQKVSLFGFLLSSIAKTIDENKELNHIRCGKKIYCFDEVDIFTAIELKHDGVPIPRIYVVRDAAKKSMSEITLEIEHAKKRSQITGTIGSNDEWGKEQTKLVSAFPKWLIKFMVRRFYKNPFKIKEMFGTTYVTSVSGFSDVPGYVMPFFEGQHRPMAFAIGNIGKKPAVVGSEIHIREFLSMTISFNHDLVDGVPAARFVNRLKQRIEGVEAIQ